MLVLKNQKTSIQSRGDVFPIVNWGGYQYVVFSGFRLNAN